MEQLEQAADSALGESSTQTLEWFKSQMDKFTKHTNPGPDPAEQERLRLQQEKEQRLKELLKQQEELSREVAALQGTTTTDDPAASIKKALAQSGEQQLTGEVLLQQLRTALSGKNEEDPNKLLLKALITQQNKTAGEGGTNTLKIGLVNRISAANTNTMAEWLATLNKQEEGESDPNSYPFPGEEDLLIRQGSRKSGILEKAVTNIQLKQVWPQQNLGEDWADEGVEFKQLRFEHLIAGKTRTIESCTDPAEILGRLRLLRRIAYLKLRGYEWHLLRKMYAAILTSIETREYSWESNFDRFETILYRKTAMDNCPQASGPRQEPRQEGRKRYCKDYNTDGCPKPSPHIAWLGSGPSTTKRTVYYYCAVCLVKDRQQLEHTQNSLDCPHNN